MVIFDLVNEPDNTRLCECVVTRRRNTCSQSCTSYDCPSLEGMNTQRPPRHPACLPPPPISLGGPLWPPLTHVTLPGRHGGHLQGAPGCNLHAGGARQMHPGGGGATCCIVGAHKAAKAFLVHMIAVWVRKWWRLHHHGRSWRLVVLPFSLPARGVADASVLQGTGQIAHAATSGDGFTTDQAVIASYKGKRFKASRYELEGVMTVVQRGICAGCTCCLRPGVHRRVHAASLIRYTPHTRPSPPKLNNGATGAAVQASRTLRPFSTGCSSSHMPSKWSSHRTSIRKASCRLSCRCASWSPPACSVACRTRLGT